MVFVDTHVLMSDKKIMPSNGFVVLRVMCVVKPLFKLNSPHCIAVFKYSPRQHLLAFQQSCPSLLEHHK